MYSPEFLSPSGFKVNRKIQDDEQSNMLRIKEEFGDFDERTPHYQLSVIELNSTFVELTDRDYSVRGISTMISLLTIAGFSWLLISLVMIVVKRWDISTDAERSSDLWFIGFASVIGLIFLSFSIFAILRESFYFTHFPVRLNRKNRKVYFWRRNGTVCSAAWDDIYFFLRCYKKTGVPMWDIVGHVLKDDRQTVKNSFALSSYTSSDAIDLRLHWEYFRRYMEDGPAQPYRMLKICLPIAKRRETWWEGFMRLSLLLHGSVIMQVIATPFNLPASLGRMFAMRTSKIPRWPDWVEQECAIAKDDPYVRESGYEAPDITKAA
jgi:hypothetical protein